MLVKSKEQLLQRPLHPVDQLMILTPLLAQRSVKLMATFLKSVELFNQPQKVKLLPFQVRTPNVLDSLVKLKASLVQSMKTMNLPKERLQRLYHYWNLLKQAELLERPHSMKLQLSEIALSETTKPLRL